MTEVRIPFTPRMRTAALTDRKTMTSRFRRYGEPGDVFRLVGSIAVHTTHSALFQIKKVQQKMLQEAASHWREEGCESEADFWAVWTAIYRNPKKQDPKVLVWLHEFERIPEPADVEEAGK